MDFKSRNWQYLADKKCAVCKKSFKPKHPQQITCGKLCSEKNSRMARELYRRQMRPKIKLKIKWGYY